MNPVIIGQATLYHADCIEVMAGLAENSLDAIICDPPYLINFMNKGFDTQHKSLPGANEGQKMQEWHRRWVTEAYRILKPGGHLAAFGGDRTHHRLMSAMEDVGFELRFNCYWVFGSGFPKSQDAAKAIENRRASNNVIRPWLRSLGTIEEIAIAAGVTNRQVDHWLGENTPCPQTLTYKRFVMLCNHFGKVPEWADSIIPKVGNKIGEITHARSGGDDFAKRPGSLSQNKTVDLRDIVSPEAKQWSGYGTALKPSVEPICVGRKPMIGTLAENLLTWGTGAMNLDACRVDYQGETPNLGGRVNAKMGGEGYGFKVEGRPVEANTLGRFPPHLLHDGSDIVKQCFPDSGNGSGNKIIVKRERNKGWCNSSPGEGVEAIDNYGDSGSASRFFPSLPYDEEDCATIFYCAKTSRTDRNQGCDDVEKKYVLRSNITDQEKDYVMAELKRLGLCS